MDLGPEDIDDIYTARMAIELEAGRLVLQQDTAELAAELNTVLERMHDALEEDRWQDVAAEDVKFHQTIVQATRSPRLNRMFSTLAAETLLCIRQLRHIHGRKETVLEQHRRLQELIRTGDETGYLAEIEWHLRKSVPMLEAARKHAVTDLLPIPVLSAN
ncbi:GntR family transcriptional regulator [Arthrobacter sp. SA17]